MAQSETPAFTLVNPLAARLRAGDIGLALMIKHARTVDIALAAKTCGFDAIYFDLQHSTVRAGREAGRALLQRGERVGADDGRGGGAGAGAAGVVAEVRDRRATAT